MTVLRDAALKMVNQWYFSTNICRKFQESNFDCSNLFIFCTAESRDRQEKDDKKTEDEKIAAHVVTVILEKAGGGTGLGFGLDGGRDSPHGDRPLTIKKLFAGLCSLWSNDTN